MALTAEEFEQAAQASCAAMFRAARALLDSDADAEDAVGQAMLQAWRSRAKLREPRAVRTWLVTITVNCARQYRKKNSHVIYCDDLERAAGGQEDRCYQELWEAVLALPQGERGVVTLFYYEDMTIAQIARALDIPEGTVKSRLDRARGRLRQWLREA